MLRRKYREIYTFSVLIQKGFTNGKTATRKLKFIDSFRFVSISLSKPVDDLPETYSKNMWR